MPIFVEKMELIYLKEATYLTDYKIEILFNNGIRSVVDLEKYLDGAIFMQLRDKDYFKNFTVNNWTVEWPNGADFSPEFLLEIAEKNFAHL